jgi:hypothetical protein
MLLRSKYIVIAFVFNIKIFRQSIFITKLNIENELFNWFLKLKA